MQVDRRLHIGQQRDVVIHSLTAHIGQFKHCNRLVHFFLWGANVFTLGSNKYYFCLQNCALPEDLHSLRGSTRDLWIIYSVSDRVISEWWWIGKDLVESGHGLILRYCPGMRLEGLRKTKKNVKQDSWSPGPRFETRTSRIRSRSLDHLTMMFGEPAWFFPLGPSQKPHVWNSCGTEVSMAINWTGLWQDRKYIGKLCEGVPDTGEALSVAYWGLRVTVWTITVMWCLVWT
jgi:hypothetical protein